MIGKLAGLALLFLVLAPDPARAFIGTTPTIRRVSLCPSDLVGDPRGNGLAMLGQNVDGSFVLIVRTFHHDTGMQMGSTLSVPIPKGTVPVELVFSAAFHAGKIMVLDTALRIHSFAVAFDADGTPKLIGPPTIQGPFANPAVVGAGTALAEAPGIDGPPYLAIGTALGRLILLYGEPMHARVDSIAPGPIEDLAAIPQVGYFAFLAVTNGRLVGINPDGDSGTPGPQPALTFSCIPPFRWRLLDIGAPPLDPSDIITAPGPVRIAAANGSPSVAVLEIPANPTFGSLLRVHAIDPKSDRIAQVAVGLMEEEGIALLGASGLGVSFDPGFSLAGGFSAADLTLNGAMTQCTNNLTGLFVTAIIEVENGLAAQIDGETIALTAGSSSVVPSLDATPHLGDEDGDGNPDLTVQFDRLDVLGMLFRERTLDVIATWKFTDDSRGRASARVRPVFGHAQ